jgi:hypothetical protein
MPAELDETQPLPHIVKRGETTLFVTFPDPKWFLNEREQKMVLLMLSGFNESQIARRWGLSRIHIESQVIRLRRRVEQEIGKGIDVEDLTYTLQVLGKISVSAGFSPRQRSLKESV